MVNAVLGTHLGGHVQRSRDLAPDSYACSYANDEGPALPATIQVEPHANERSITAWSDFAKHPLTRIPDLGDEAGSWSEVIGGSTVNGVIARRGELLLLVVAFAPVDRVKALTAKVFELIG